VICPHTVTTYDVISFGALYLWNATRYFKKENITLLPLCKAFEVSLAGHLKNKCHEMHRSDNRYQRRGKKKRKKTVVFNTLGN